MLTENPSKAQELQHWDAFLATLPRESYLAMYLDGSREVLAQRMGIDMACELFTELAQLKTQAELATKEAIATRDKAQNEMIALQAQVSCARRELRRLEDSSKDIARAAHTLHDRAAEAYHQIALATKGGA